LTAVTLFALFWIPNYFKSIKYLFTETDVRVEIGVWRKERHAIPYSRIMNVDTIQGPISRIYGLGTVDIYTAGYTGVAGGTGGPKARRAEASLINVPDFHDLREQVLEVVRGKPLFGLPAAATDNISEQMLSELKEIRKLMETKS
jgi:membrane protein YdbS with pleckstrin-like domain